MMTIQWRPIPDFPDYEASNTGIVRSHKRNTPRILKPATHPGGYRTVLLRRNGKTYCSKIGHLVLFAFRGPCPEGYEMCHNDGSPTNDRLDNLRWDTHSSNMQDASRHIAIRRAESRSPIANEDFVNAVEATQKELGMTQMEFAEYLGVNQGTLSKLYSRGIKDSFTIKILRKYPEFAHYFVKEPTP